MNKKQKVLNTEQSLLVAELCGMYGIEPEQIIFFENDSKPFLTYEANAVLCNHLTDLIHIGVEPVASPFADSVSVKCTIALKNGNERTAVGVANLSEKTDEDFEVSEQQAFNLASSRALRNTLRAAGIDLIKLHKLAINGGEIVDFNSKSNFVSLLGQVHKLGTEVGLIKDGDKSAWYALLNSRYGVSNSNELNEDRLSDFAALLKTFVPAQKIAA